MDKLTEALAEYQTRQSRKSHPDGRFDNGGRWYPSDREKQECCKRMRSPSRRWPYSLLHHCRTLRHVAKLYGVPETKLRALAREERGPVEINREGGEDYYKVVADFPDGRMVSIFDGETEYRLGEEVRDTPRQDHNGGIYVYPTLAAARWVYQHGVFPERSVLHPHSPERAAGYAILRVRAEGAYCRYPSTGGNDEYDKLAFSRVTPLEVVEILE